MRRVVGAQKVPSELWRERQERIRERSRACARGSRRSRKSAIARTNGTKWKCVSTDAGGGFFVSEELEKKIASDRRNSELRSRLRFLNDFSKFSLNAITQE